MRICGACAARHQGFPFQVTGALVTLAVGCNPFTLRECPERATPREKRLPYGDSAN